MKTINPNQRKTAFILLMALFLQSCGAPVPFTPTKKKDLRSGARSELPISEAKSLLSAHYQQPAFTKMNTFLEDAPVLAQDMEFCIKLNEQVKVRTTEESSQTAVYSGQSQYTHPNEGRQDRLQWVQKPIALADLFKPRSLRPDEPNVEIKKVLLVGEAGTGKTALTRKLAYDWTIGTWGQEFTALYVLPVRNLRQDKYQGVSETLATAIANECFTEEVLQPAYSRPEDLLKIYTYIIASLQRPTTLVILDGLDEHLGTSQVILDQAKHGQHKLLLTSRPYDMQDALRLVDIEVEHMGLDVHQQEYFVRRTLRTAEYGLVDSLLTFMRDADLPARCLIPVNLLMLCTLWKARGTELEQPEDVASVDLNEWYQRLVDHIWKRFASKEHVDHQGPESERGRLFKKLEKIALTTAKDSKASIDPGIIQEYVLGRPASSFVEDAGFLLFEKIAWRYHFSHLTFHEYFAGKSLRGQFC
ncbi:MAG: NACHT domain-containing protein [Bacteroidota bacterium]